MTELQHIAAFCEQTARDGILPSLAWFSETAATLRSALTPCGVEALTRLKALARENAEATHSGWNKHHSATYDNKHPHGRPSTLIPHDLDFATCPHPDCALVRSDVPSCAVEALPTIWRKAADDFGRNPFSDASCLRQCADALASALRGTQTEKDHED